MRAIWDGTGELDFDRMAAWTKDNGEIVGRPYVRRRCASHVARWSFLGDYARRRSAAFAATVDNEAWLARHHGETVGSICRQVENALLCGGAT